MSPPLSPPFGVVYSPESIQEYKAPNVQILKRNGVKYIRVTWLDYSSTIRYHVVPINHFERMLKSARPGITLPRTILSIVWHSCPEGYSETGEHRYALDLESLRICLYAPGHASVFGWFQESEANPITKSLAMSCCPRTTLQKLITDAQNLQTSFLVGIETEFVLIKQTDRIEPLGPHSRSCSSTTYSGSLASVILEEIAETLQAGGVELETYHAEAGNGQYEVVTGPLPPLQAADAVVFTRETVFNVANKHGLRATLMPKMLNEKYGTGAHTHVSIHSTGVDESTSPLAPGLKSYEASFLQSMLTNIPAICAFSLPLRSSYDRVADGSASGGTYISWGAGNKEASIRLCGSKGGYNFELKCVDGTSNPYLVIAGIVASGLDAIINKRELSMGECVASAAKLSPEGRKERGIIDRMPLTIEEAREKLKSNEMMSCYLGDELVTKYLDTNKLLQKHFSADSHELELEKVAKFY